MQNNLLRAIVKLYQKCATELPKDVFTALEKAKKTELTDSSAKIIETILENAKLAKTNSLPICQDTGTPIFYIKHKNNYPQKELIKIINDATAIATNEVPLRPNAVNPLTGENSGNNTGLGFPIINFEEHDSDELEITLILKGGGSENIGQIYSLPNKELNADRNIEGIRKCALDAIQKAQGKGCSPTIVLIGIAGIMEQAVTIAKKQLLRKLYDENENSELDKLEKQILNEANKLGIGPMGLGGNTTILAAKIGYAYRNPPSFFVNVSFNCWALRKTKLIYKNGEAKYE